MDKSDILQEIKRLAEASGGVPPGRAAFEKATGIRQQDWYPSIWLRWGDALIEAGYAPNRLATRSDDAAVLDSYIRFVRELGRVPVAGELRLRGKSDPAFPAHTVFSRFGGRQALLRKVQERCLANSDYSDVAALLPKLKAEDPTSEVSARAPVQGHVYMMRSGRRYKIGFTNSPVRRHREVRIELPDRTDLIHSIETDDPRGIEAYWHRRFETKRVRDTEFFELDAGDVAAFKRRKYQ